MKTFSTFILIFFILNLFSCVQGNLPTESTRKSSAYVLKAKNLTCNDIEIGVLKGNEEIKTDEFIYGEKIYFKFLNIDGFKVKEGKINPGLSMKVYDESGELIFKITDLFLNSKGLSQEKNTIVSNLIAANPMFSKVKHKVEIKIWDKNGNGTIDFITNFITKDNKNLKIENSTFKYNSIYLSSKKYQEVIVDNKYEVNDIVYLYLEGLKGFEEKNNLVYPELFVEIKDSEGNVLIEKTNLLAEYSENGANPEDVEKVLFFNIKESVTSLNKILVINLDLNDKLNNSKMNIKTILEPKK